MNEIDSFISYLKDKQFSHSTLNTNRRVISFYLSWVAREGMEVVQVSYQDLLGFVKYCGKKGITQKTTQHYLNTVKHYYNHLIEEGITTANPTLGVEIKGVKRQVLYHIIESHELHQLYNQYPSETLAEKRNKVMLGLLAYQGLKTEELSKMMIDDVNLREGKINVPGGKNSNQRLMQLESHQVMDMYDYIQRVRQSILDLPPKRSYQQKQATDQLFIGNGGYCYSLSNLMTRLMVKVRKLNPNVQNAKQIRASVITKWVKQYNLRKAQYLAGHRYISSTESYLRNDMEGLKEEINMYHPLS